MTRLIQSFTNMELILTTYLLIVFLVALMLTRAKKAEYKRMEELRRELTEKRKNYANPKKP